MAWDRQTPANVADSLQEALLREITPGGGVSGRGKVYPWDRWAAFLWKLDVGAVQPNSRRTTLARLSGPVLAWANNSGEIFYTGRHGTSRSTSTVLNTRAIVYDRSRRDDIAKWFPIVNLKRHTAKLKITNKRIGFRPHTLRRLMKWWWVLRYSMTAKI